MNERKTPISRIPVPIQGHAGGIERVVVTSEPGAAERPIAGVLLAIWRGRWIVVACLAISLVVGYIRVKTAVPVYSASSTICVQQASILPDLISTGGQTGNYLITQCQIIHSTSLMTKAYQQPGVADAQCLRSMPAEAAVGYLKNAVIVGPDKQGGDLIEIEMQSLNPNDAAVIVNGVASAYIAYQADQHTATGMEMMDKLQKEIDRQNAELFAEQRKVTDFKKANPALVQQIEQGKAATNPLASELSQARSTTLELQIAHDRAQHLQDNPEALKQVVDGVSARVQLPANADPVVDPGLLEEYRQARQDWLIQSPGQDRNLALQPLKNRLERLEADVISQRKEAVKKYLAFLDEQLEASKDREAALQKSVSEQQLELNDIFTREAEYDQLVEQTQNTQRALDMLYNQIKTVHMNSDVGVLTASVLEPAKPGQTTGSGKSKIMGMAIVAGLMAGLGGSLLREMLEQRIRSVEEVGRLLAAPILGSVPHIVTKSGRFLSSRMPSGAQVLSYLGAAGPKNRRHWNSAQSLMRRGQTMHLNPRSDIAESYRSIRTAIYFGLQRQPAKTILVTSPSAGDGKTTLASNLAIAIAQAGRRVLLIDADCWHPTQHQIFGLGDGPGLTTVLRKKATLEEMVRKTDIENLEILPCGELPNNPAELLGSAALVDLLTQAAGTYDQVLIDSPPVVPITDARILAANCGATILVLRAGKSTRRSADEAFEVLTSVNAHILGLVVNDVARQARSHAYQYYNYSTVSDREDWNQYAPTEESNGHAAPNGQNGNGHIVHLPGVIVEPDETTGQQVD